jgi:PKHD-type hydroxylase
MPAVQKYINNLSQFTVCEKAFTPDEIDYIISLESKYEFNHGQVGAGDGRIENSTRDSEVGWIHEDAESKWIFNKFSKMVSEVNYRHFLVDIDKYDSFQYTIYKPSHHYTWHYDLFDGYTERQRKISAVIMLSSPSEYDGGELDIITNGNPETPVSLKLQKGDIVFFASWMSHRVRPVFSGIRKTLVCWIEGKRTW